MGEKNFLCELLNFSRKDYLGVDFIACKSKSIQEEIAGIKTLYDQYRSFAGNAR